MHARVPAPGTPIWIRQRRWTVERARLDRGVIRLDVAHGARRLTFLSPFDRPATVDDAPRPMRVRRQRALARLAWALGASHPFDMPIAAIDARVDLLPYQLEPTLALLAGTRRVLVADEVGLGKTIQAGLAAAELRRRRPSSRILIVVPATLVDQWMDELVSRFSLTPRHVDQDALDEDARKAAAGAWSPWTRPGVSVTSTDFLKQRHVIDAVPLAPWDLVVIDEAHGVAGDSQRRDACDEIARRARHVLLLSATPHAGDADRYHRLRDLGALGGGDTLQVFRRTRADAGMRAIRTIRWRRVDGDEHVTRLIDALLAFEHAVAGVAGGAASPAALLLLTVFRKRAGSTLHALDRTLTRRLQWLDAPERAHTLEWLQPRLRFDDDETEERTALIGESGLPPARERTWLRRLRVLAAAAMPRDPKIARVRTLLTRTREPVVVFTEFRASADALEHALRRVRSLAVLHGELSPVERRDALRRFLHGRASVLIATDVGGQGLNLQVRARWVINLELPWNPARLAQRIGRVDRIGQTRRVYATILVNARAERPVVAALARRAHLARDVMGLDTLVDAMPPVELQIEHSFAPSPLGPLVPSPVPSSLGPSVHSSPGPSVPSSSAPSSLGPLIPSPVPSCVRWRRRARAMARALAQRRRWMRQWRGQPLHGARPYVCASVVSGAGGPEARRLRFEQHQLAVFTVPIVTANGDVLERHVVALEADRAITPSLAVLQHVAIERATKRLARIRGPLLAAAAACAAIERAIDTHLQALRCPEDTQLEFFSLHAARERSRATSDAARLDLDRRLGDLRAEATIETGRPVLELMAGRWR
jgi:superfamily II DNA or RNA helicase